MILLKSGISGNEVKKWQYFLTGLGYYKSKVDGLFKKQTKSATIDFQMANGLVVDGVVGRNTFIKAVELGFGSFSLSYPDRPHFKPITNSLVKSDLFGAFDFKHTPTDSNPEKVTITSEWKDENIVKVYIPQLEKATNGKYKSMRFHKKCVYQLQEFFKEVEEKGFLSDIISYQGAYTARFIRGSRTHLSNHSWGTAFDVNAEWNGLGREPASEKQEGSLFNIVPIAIKWGFYWGGHFGRKDGMHFEVAKIINKPRK